MTTTLTHDPQVLTDGKPGYLCHSVKVDGHTWIMWEDADDDGTYWCGSFARGGADFSGYAPPSTTFADGDVADVIAGAHAYIDNLKAYEPSRVRDWSADVAAIEALKRAALA